MTVANRITGETGTMGASGSEMVGGRGEAFGGQFLGDTLVELGTEQKNVIKTAMPQWMRAKQKKSVGKNAIKTATASAIQKQRQPRRGTGARNGGPQLGTGCPMRKDAIQTATTIVMDGALASTSGALLRMWVGRQGAKISNIGGLQRMGGPSKE
ncbi:hypothetical protein C8J57DRAFT_1226387 [Mycena rebaudengoi]|nr:hypothetical protein C8J57DRAFT_1226387 [Mycena rebaudengoi]